MDTNSLLDAVKTRLNITSERALAREAFKVDVASLRDMRQRGLSDERALQVATLLDLNAGEVLAAIRAERAKSPEVRAVWQKVAESMRSALGMVTAATVAALLFLSHAQPAIASVASQLCVLC